MCLHASYSNSFWHTNIENASEMFVVCGVLQVGAKGLLIQESEYFQTFNL